MKKLLLSTCVAAACWMNPSEAMKGKDVNGEEVSIRKCVSGRFLMIDRWELGHGLPGNCEYLHISYQGVKEKLDQEGRKAEITQEMRDLLYTLPGSVGRHSRLKVLEIVGDKDKDNERGYSMCLEVLPGSIGNLVNLKTLYLPHNGLGYIPDSIGNLKNLEILDVSDNDLRTLPDSIGNLKNLEELRLSDNRYFLKLPDSIGNLKKLKVLDLNVTKLNSLPESLGNLTNLWGLSLSGATQGRNGYYYGNDYSPAWYLNVINQSLKHWSCPTIDYSDNDTSALDLSGKSLKQIPFGVYMMDSSRRDGNRRIPALKELDVSNNQITEIPRLLAKLPLKKLYLHNNPNLNHLPDFLWEMSDLKELKINGKLIKDLPKGAKYSLDNKDLESAVLGLTLDGKNNKKMSDEELAKRTGPYIVHLKR